VEKVSAGVRRAMVTICFWFHVFRSIQAKIDVQTNDNDSERFLLSCDVLLLFGVLSSFRFSDKKDRASRHLNEVSREYNHMLQQKKQKQSRVCQSILKVPVIVDLLRV